MRKNIGSYIVFAGTLLFVSCSPGKREASEEDNLEDVDDQIETTYGTYSPDVVGGKAVAELSQVGGSGVEGKVTFKSTPDGVVEIEVKASNLPEGKHALHLHEKGDCSAPDAKSAGGHWNPTNKNHGKRGEGEFHKGDITNLEAGSDGNVSWSEEIKGWTIGGPDSTNILNKAVIIHAGADDFTSQPSGNAGSRIACGVITGE